MNRRVNEVKRRIAERKKQPGGSEKPTKPVVFPVQEEQYSVDDVTMYEYTPTKEKGHPLFRKEIFLFKFLASACLVLVVAILFKNPSPHFTEARHFVNGYMEKEFQFAAVSSWYEKAFGKPLSILPLDDKKQGETITSDYAVPASGHVLQSFKKTGHGIIVETGSKSVVEAMSEGFVSFIGQKQGFGKTVVIQHADGTEAWYGNLDKVDVNLYDFVDKKKKVGSVSSLDDGKKGTYSFAIKKGEKFIDPSKVINFE